MGHQLSFPQDLTLAREGTEGIAECNNASLTLLILHLFICLLTRNSRNLLYGSLALALLIDLLQLAEEEVVVVPDFQVEQVRQSDQRCAVLPTLLGLGPGSGGGARVGLRECVFEHEGA